jgi:CBS domain-containing protein
MATNTKYSQIKAFRDQELSHVSPSSTQLNSLHDDIIKQTVNLAVDSFQSDFGPPPSPFCFFVMGSAGRYEQGIWSDQDHGIIFKETKDSKAQKYFLALGKEISDGLVETGYKKCDGRVMANNPLWCKSFGDWEKQLKSWVLTASWEYIRHLLTFIDGRCLYGEDLIVPLKQSIYPFIHQEHLLSRILENTMHVKKGIGVLGQFLVDTHGPMTGTLNIKETALFPYVNAARVIAIRERSLKTSTYERLQLLPDSLRREKYARQFLNLQRYRLQYGIHTSYDSGHYLAIGKLSKQQRKEFKEIMKDGISLFDYVRELVEKDDQYGHE